MLFALRPRTNILNSIIFKLLSFPFFKAVYPITFIQSIILLGQEFDNSIPMSFVLLKNSWVYVLSWDIFISPTWFLTFPNIINCPSSEIKLTLVIPYDCPCWIEDKWNAVFILFYTKSSWTLCLQVYSESFECHFSQIYKLLLIHLAVRNLFSKIYEVLFDQLPKVWLILQLSLNWLLDGSQTLLFSKFKLFIDILSSWSLKTFILV